MKNQEFFKVLRRDLSSVGLLGAPRKQYYLGVWNKPDEALSGHSRRGGGLWATPTQAAAKSFQKYVLRKHGIQTRLFRCRIGRILHQTSCRVKTDRLFFTKKDEVVN
ncbi:MAG: hypothetical protein HYT66_00815 [Candidatus Yanofskybacteria bacterium]|nr:hypothetical protein [Candidatus Yanofskybacteria bacterium]